jgi:di/tricarboxylate transporter
LPVSLEQLIVFGTLGLALGLFIWGRWRYDLVALLALLIVTVSGIVSGGEAFAGFGHPAIVTVAAVLVVSRGLQNAGLVDRIASWMTRVGDRPTLQVAALTALVTACSAFMNNVGALGLLMPVALRMAHKSGNSPAILLMPLAFGSLLGGMTTLIGTPPNVIIATFRVQAGAAPFRMFDFAPVGGGVALAGLVFIALIGWRLIPRRQGQGAHHELFQIAEYITEVRVPQDSTLVGKSLRDLELTAEADVNIVGLVRGQRRLLVPSSFEVMWPGDILIVEADPEALKTLVDTVGLELVASQALGEEALGSEDVGVMEAVIMPSSVMEGRTAIALNLRWRYGVNLLAVARQGARLRERLKNVRFRVGDVVLLQGRTEALPEVLSILGCLPLAERGVRLGQPRRIALSTGIFAAALALAAMGLLPVQIAFVAAAVAMITVGMLSLREAYESIDWSILMLLGAMIPVGQALESTGGAQLIADRILALGQQLPAGATLAVVLVGTMFLSDLVNNAAAAVLMAPIAIGVAQGLGASADPFLMAVAIGASCAFLTPIGHQSNTLVLGPGGYRFGDYWRMGLPLEVIVAVVAIPLLLWFWPPGIGMQ